MMNVRWGVGKIKYIAMKMSNKFLQFVGKLFLLRPAKLEADAKKSFQEMKEDQGRFIYDEDGFVYPFSDGERKVKWSSIERLEGYKQDLMTADQICMDITFEGSHVTFSEETPGWYIFQEKLHAALPGVSSSWEYDVMFPAFANNFTVLYEREDRKMPAATNFHALFKNIKRGKVQRALEKRGWTSRKESSVYTGLSNAWTELSLEDGASELLLHGIVAYHPDNIRLLDNIFDSLGVFYRYEIYDDQGVLLLEKKSALGK